MFFPTFAEQNLQRTRKIDSSLPSRIMTWQTQATRGVTFSCSFQFLHRKSCNEHENVTPLCLSIAAFMPQLFAQLTRSVGVPPCHDEPNRLPNWSDLLRRSEVEDQRGAIYCTAASSVTVKKFLAESRAFLSFFGAAPTTELEQCLVCNLHSFSESY